MRFQRTVIRCYESIPNHTSFVIHSTGCNFNCYGCFNYEALIANPKNTCGEKEILDLLERNKNLGQIVILSGGEPLIHPIGELENFLVELKKNWKTVLYTNGSFPDKLSFLIEKKLLDGVHLDIKTLPNGELEEKVLGVSQSYSDKIYQSAEIIAQTDLPLSQFRTVHYPFYSNNDLDKIGDALAAINKKYNTSIPWFVNEYVNVEN